MGGGGGLLSHAFSLKNPTNKLRKRQTDMLTIRVEIQTDRQTARGVWHLVVAAPPSTPQALGGSSEFVLWLLLLHTLHCTSVLTDSFFPPWHGHALRVAHTSHWLAPLLLAVPLLPL